MKPRRRRAPAIVFNGRPAASLPIIIWRNLVLRLPWSLLGRPLAACRAPCTRPPPSPLISAQDTALFDRLCPADKDGKRKFAPVMLRRLVKQGIEATDPEARLPSHARACLFPFPHHVHQQASRAARAVRSPQPSIAAALMRMCASGSLRRSDQAPQQPARVCAAHALPHALLHAGADCRAAQQVCSARPRPRQGA